MRRCATTLEAEMSAAEHEFLLGILQREKFPGRHLEIGTAAGGTLCHMMQCFDNRERPPFVVVDPMSYFPDQLPSVKRNLDRHGLNSDEVDFRVCKSDEAFDEAVAQNESFDFMLIDGCHKILSVTTDLQWTRLLKVGGVVCLHDYCWKHKGVFFAVNRFLASHPNYEVIGCVDSLLALRKRETSRFAEVTPAAKLFAMLLYLPLQVERKLAKIAKKAA
jgi:predicted O-methyltransferase YrrM